MKSSHANDERMRMTNSRSTGVEGRSFQGLRLPGGRKWLLGARSGARTWICGAKVVGAAGGGAAGLNAAGCWASRRPVAEARLNPPAPESLSVGRTCRKSKDDLDRRV